MTRPKYEKELEETKNKLYESMILNDAMIEHIDYYSYLYALITGISFIGGIIIGIMIGGLL